MTEEEKEQYIHNIQQLEKEKKWKAIAAILKELNEMDAAELMEILAPDSMVVVFRILPKDFAADLFANLDTQEQGIILNAASEKEVGVLLEELMVDDAVDALEELPANVVSRLLSEVSPQTRATINKFLAYPEDSVGSIMTAEFLGLKKSMTVKEAIERVRKGANESEQIYNCYVMDSSRHLEGAVSLKDLILAKDNDLIDDIMDTDLISATTSEDRENVAELFSKYDLLSMPVVDAEHRLVGIVTVDDVIDVMQEELTEDMEKMAAMTPSDTPYLKSSIFKLARNRIVWLILLMFSSVFSSLVLTSNTAVFSTIPLLIAFIPMLTDAAGNAGSQSSATIIRSIATHELDTKDFYKAFFKELCVGLIAGFTLAICNFIRIICQYHDVKVAFAVSAALVFTVMIAKLLGCALPFLARFVKVDPALMAAPIISTVMDTVSLVVYVLICKLIFLI